MSEDHTLTARLALAGRVVTMDPARAVLGRGVVYIAGGRVVAALPDAAPPPPGFADTARLNTRGTIYPGLIELHNHLPYNVLPRWATPARYTSRSQWGRHPDYRRLVSGPMGVLGAMAHTLEAVVRYTEAKCLLGGVTTSQGIALFSNAGTARAYRGAVRNVESPDADDLPGALTRIADVEATRLDSFWRRLQRSSCLLLHLSEGTDEATRRAFGSLRRADGSWALSPALAGIHAVALQPDDVAVLAEHGASVVWSPVSNLCLYGATAAIAEWKARGLRVGLGSDWSLSGSKNLLAELKVARLLSRLGGGVFSDAELVEMATCGAAAILGWGGRAGCIEAGAHADLLVVRGLSGDPYGHLLGAAETEIDLVVIGGARRYGLPRLMPPVLGLERWRVAGRGRLLDLREPTDPDLPVRTTLRAARDTLADALGRLPELAGQIERGEILSAAAGGLRLLLEEGDPFGAVSRPYIDVGEEGLSVERAPALGAATPLSELLGPMPSQTFTFSRLWCDIAHPDPLRGRLDA